MMYTIIGSKEEAMLMNRFMRLAIELDRGIRGDIALIEFTMSDSPISQNEWTGQLRFQQLTPNSLEEKFKKVITGD